MKYGFSSLACMEASFPELITYAKEAGLDALEIRLDREDKICGLTTQQVLTYLPALQEAGLIISDLGTSVSFFEYDADKISRAMKNIDLAAAVGAKGVRLFLDKNKTSTPHFCDTEGIVRALKEVCVYGVNCGIEIWLETHGAFSTAASLRPILDAAAMPNLKIIWDIIHSVEYGESPEESIALIGKEICHVHIKDGVRSKDPNHIQYTLGALGAGEVDTAKSIRLLDAIGYTGTLSLEWESAWHPELKELYRDIPTLLTAFLAYTRQ